MADVLSGKHTLRRLPSAPLWAFFCLPRGRLLKVHAEPCMYAPGYLQSNKPRWPGAESARATGAPTQGGV